jgi:hypothetical protein
LLYFRSAGKFMRIVLFFECVKIGNVVRFQKTKRAGANYIQGKTSIRVVFLFGF